MEQQQQQENSNSWPCVCSHLKTDKSFFCWHMATGHRMNLTDLVVFSQSVKWLIFLDWLKKTATAVVDVVVVVVVVFSEQSTNSVSIDQQ